MTIPMQQFYLARAADAKRDAKDATLTNVRERWLSAEKTWKDLATRAARVDRLHAQRVAKAASAREALRAPQGPSNDGPDTHDMTDTRAA